MYTQSTPASTFSKTGVIVIVWEVVGDTIVLIVVVRLVKVEVTTTSLVIVIGFTIVTVVVGVVAIQEQASESIDNAKLLRTNINSIVDHVLYRMESWGHAAPFLVYICLCIPYREYLAPQ